MKKDDTVELLDYVPSYKSTATPLGIDLCKADLKLPLIDDADRGQKQSPDDSDEAVDGATKDYPVKTRSAESPNVASQVDLREDVFERIVGTSVDLVYATFLGGCEVRICTEADSRREQAFRSCVTGGKDNR